MENNHLKGMFHAAVSALSVSLVFIFSKQVQRDMGTEDFVFWWFAFGSLWAGVLLWVRREHFKGVFSVLRRHPYFVSYFIISEVFGAFLFFYLVKKINPAVFAFIGTVVPFFVAVIAFLYIQERLRVREVVGGLISMVGVVIITYVSPDVPLKYLGIAVFILLMFSFSNVLVRKTAQDMRPEVMTVMRIFSLFVVFGIFGILRGGVRAPVGMEVVYLVAGSLAGPILGITFLFSALKYTKAGVVALIKNSQPFLVALMAAVFLGETMSTAQWLGGTVIVFGISLLIKSRH